MLDQIFMWLGIILVLLIVIVGLLVKFGGASVSIKNTRTGETKKWGDD